MNIMFMMLTSSGSAAIESVRRRHDQIGTQTLRNG